MIKEYIKKPIPIKAIKLTDDTWDLVEKWLHDEGVYCDNDDRWCPSGEAFYIPTMEGDMKLTKGNYLVQGIRGEFYPCDAEIFEESYGEIKCRGVEIERFR